MAPPTCLERQVYEHFWTSIQQQLCPTGGMRCELGVWFTYGVNAALHTTNKLRALPSVKHLFKMHFYGLCHKQITDLFEFEIFRLVFTSLTLFRKQLPTNSGFSTQFSSSMRNVLQMNLTQSRGNSRLSAAGMLLLQLLCLLLYDVQSIFRIFLAGCFVDFAAIWRFYDFI